MTYKTDILACFKTLPVALYYVNLFDELRSDASFSAFLCYFCPVQSIKYCIVQSLQNGHLSIVAT